jgi:hypothetical protein
MSDIDAALIYELKHNAGVAALVGTRIFSVDLDQGAQMPAITVQRVDSPRQVFEHGNPSAFPKAKYQIGSWSGTFAGAVALAAMIAAALNGEDGVWGTGAIETDIQNCQVVDQRDFKDPTSVLYNRQTDVSILFKE